jgi:hypothetical protein
MKKKIMILCLLVISSIFGYSQTGKINNSDFAHYTDCQQLDNWKTDKGDTLKIKKSFSFDSEGNVIRKLEEVPENPPKSKQLTVYQYDNKRLLNEILYKRTDMDNIFQSNQLIYFYNTNGLIDSQVVINSYPYFNYKLIDGISDSIRKLQNIREFDEPIWKPLSEDTSSSPHAVMTTIKDGKEVMITGYTKVKKEVSLLNIFIDTATTCKYYYNTKKQRVKEFFGFDGWNISDRTIINYDKNNRLSSVLCYTKNSYKIKDEARMDSTNLWMRAFYTDSLKREDAIKRVELRMKEEMSDTLLKYNSYLTYNKDGSTTELAVYSNQIYKLTSYRNKNGQMVKTINSHTIVQNTYENGRFIPTDIKAFPSYDFPFYETTSVYEYDVLGRIIKCTEKYIDNNDYGKMGYRNSENFTLYKYKNDLPLKLPESEYIDGYSNEHHYYSIRK